MNYLEIDEVISQAMLSAQDIKRIVPVGMNGARKIVNRILQEMIADGSPVIDYTRKKYVPTERVLKHLGMNANLIHREARIIKEREKL